MSALQTIFALPDFRRLFAGVTTSQLGDQFALIATPWLVLQLTGDPLALGLVLALEGAPRALLMLVGGAVTDRMSARTTMLITDIIRFALVLAMALAVLSGRIDMWMVYAFSLAIGVVAGFAVPAGNAILPTLVAEGDLQAGNAAIMGGAQVMGFAGPVVAGILIGASANSLLGVGTAFLIDAATFGFSALMLWRMQAGRAAAPTSSETEAERLWTSILAGIRFVWQQGAMRQTYLLIAAINLVFVGPIMVGIPILADDRLAEGASAFGLLMSGFAGGNLVGYLLAGTLPQPSDNRIRLILIGQLLAFAGALAAVGLVASTWIDFALLLALGIGTGYVTIVLISAIQANTPKDMLGRIMGLLMFCSSGMIPVSQAAAGAISRLDVTAMFLTSAGLMVLVTLWVTSGGALHAMTGAMARNTDSEGPD